MGPTVVSCGAVTVSRVDMMYTSSLLPLEILPESVIDDLGIGQVVQVCLPADGLNPALFDVEGGALGFTAGIMGLVQGSFALVPPGYQLLQVAHHTCKHVSV